MWKCSRFSNTSIVNFSSRTFKVWNRRTWTDFQFVFAVPCQIDRPKLNVLNTINQIQIFVLTLIFQTWFFFFFFHLTNQFEIQCYPFVSHSIWYKSIGEVRCRRTSMRVKWCAWCVQSYRFTPHHWNYTEYNERIVEATNTKTDPRIGASEWIGDD